MSMSTSKEVETWGKAAANYRVRSPSYSTRRRKTSRWVASPDEDYLGRKEESTYGVLH